MANTIRHQGIVENIEGSHLQVRIVQTSACATCSIKGHCTSADTKEKLIDIVESGPHTYRQGDRVWVLGELSMGMQAVLLAFVIPLFLIIITLLVGMALFADELKAVFCVVPCLIAYYFALWCNKDWLRRKFSFSICPQE